MRTNTTKAKLAAGQVVFGAIISRPAPDQVELFGAIGYDFVMIDCEHGPMSLDDVEHMVRAAEVFGITPITRIPNHEDSTILRFLDRGVQGIIVPHVNTRAAAEAVARAARYWPDGHRGMAGGRPHDYGVGVSRDESTRWINAELLVIPMIEETEAVDNLDAGDAWLIELQMYPPETNQATPMEYLQVNYDVIFNGVWSRDVICMEAGANGYIVKSDFEQGRFLEMLEALL